MCINESYSITVMCSPELAAIGSVNTVNHAKYPKTMCASSRKRNDDPNAISPRFSCSTRELNVAYFVCEKS